MIKEYKCTECGKVVEVWERFDTTPTKCPKCGNSLKKIMSKNTFQLKGSGWYCTDYKNKSAVKGGH